MAGTRRQVYGETSHVSETARLLTGWPRQTKTGVFFDLHTASGRVSRLMTCDPQRFPAA